MKTKTIKIGTAIFLSLLTLQLLSSVNIASSLPKASASKEWEFEALDVFNTVAISADGNYVICGGNENKVHLLNKTGGA